MVESQDYFAFLHQLGQYSEKAFSTCHIPYTLFGVFVKIHIVLQSPLTPHARRRIDTETLETYGFDYSFWDATDLLIPQLRHAKQPLTGEEVKVLRNVQDLVKAARQISEADVVLFIGGAFPGQVEGADSPYQVLARTGATLAAISVGHLPGLPARRRFSSLVSQGPSRLAQVARERLSARRMARGLRGLDIAWVGTSAKSLSNLVVTNSTWLRPVHVFDYEEIREALALTANTGTKERHPIVMLHDGGPEHPDYGTVAPREYTLGQAEYYSMLCRALMRVAQLTGREVIVAAHPRTFPGSLDLAFAPFQVEYGSTAKLIADAAYILDPACSTAVAMAVVARRPYAYLRSSAIGARLTALQLQSAQRLRSPLIDIETSDFVWPTWTVSMEAYLAYEAEYVKIPGTSPERFWSQLIKDLVEFRNLADRRDHSTERE